MGTKLKVKIITMLCVLTISCSSKKNVMYESKGEFIQAFKVSVLYGCINEATNGEFQKFSINNNDLGLALEVSVLFHSETEYAIKIGEELSKKIRTINYSDYQGKKPIFSDCVNFAFSKEIDSLALAKYKEWKNAKIEYIND